MDSIGNILLLTFIYVFLDFLMLGPKGRDWREISREVGIIDKLYPKHYINARKLDVKVLGYRVKKIPKLVYVELNMYYSICVLSILPILAPIVLFMFGKTVYYLYTTIALCAYPVMVCVFVFYSAIIEIYLTRHVNKQRKEWAKNHGKSLKTKITKDQVLEFLVVIIFISVILLIGGIVVWLMP